MRRTSIDKKVNAIYKTKMPSEKQHSPHVEIKRKKRINTILDAAMAIIMDKGPSGLTMRHLAEKVNMTAGALYRYFKTKGDIIGGLGNRALNSYMNAIMTGVKSAKSQFADSDANILSLHCILKIHFEYIGQSIKDYEHYRILNMIMVNPERFMTSESDYREFMGNAIALLQFAEKQFDNAVDLGALRPGNGFERALLLLTMMNGSLQLIKFGEEMPDLINSKAIQSASINNLLLGMGADSILLQKANDLFE